MFLVIVVWFCCSSWMVFLMMNDPISKTAFFTPLSYFSCRRSFCSYTFLFEKYCCSFGRHLCQKWGWAWSELYVRTHITEPPCYFSAINPTSLVFSWISRRVGKLAPVCSNRRLVIFVSSWIKKLIKNFISTILAEAFNRVINIKVSVMRFCNYFLNICFALTNA